MSDYEDRRAASGDKPDRPRLPDNGGVTPLRGKRPTLPGLYELFEEKPLRILSPLEFTEIMQRPTPLSDEGASVEEIIYHIYTRLAEIENGLAQFLHSR